MAFGGYRVVGTELLVEVVENEIEMLVCLLVVDVVDDRVLEVLHGVKVVLEHEFTPNLNDLLVKGSSLDDGLLVFKKFAHVVVTAAQVVAFRAMLHALLVDTLRQLIECLGLCFRSVLRQEKSAESFVQVSGVRFNFFLVDEGVFVATVSTASLFSLIRRKLKQVPVCCDQKLLSLFETSTSQADVGLGEDEVGGQQLNRALTEHSIRDLLSHLFVDFPVRLLNVPVDNITLRVEHRSVDFLFTLESSVSLLVVIIFLKASHLLSACRSVHV